MQPITKYQFEQGKENHALAEIRAANIITVAILTGTVGHGGTIPLPTGYTQDQCKWMVSPYNIQGNTTMPYALLQIQCYANANRVVTCLGRDVTDSWISGTANYIIIGTKFMS